MSLTLEIVTPERRVFSDTVDHVVLPTKAAGEIDILPGHIPLMTMIEPGALAYFKDGQPHTIAIDKGFIEVVADTVRVLTEAAIEVEKIDPAQVEAARRSAEQALAEAKARGDDAALLEELETKASFALVQELLSGKSRR